MERSRLALVAALAVLLALVGYLALRSSSPDPHAPIADRGGEAPTSSTTARRPDLAPPARRSADVGAVAEVKTATRPASTQIVFEVPWGSALGQLGQKVANESNPEGPMAMAVEGDDVVVLDQANGRVQRFRRGVAVSSFPVSETVQDIALAKDGRTALLDRLADKNVVIHAADGARIAEIPLAGKGIEDPSVTTGVFMDDEGVWVEREHGSLVRVADAEGTADEARPETPGRRTQDGRRVVTAAVADAALGRVVVTAFVQEDLQIAWAVTHDFSRPLLQILMLESDAASNVYVGAEGARERADFSVYDAAIMVTRFGLDGGVTGRIELPALASGNESHRPLAIGDDGALYVMQSTDTGVVVTRHTFSGPG